MYGNRVLCLFLISCLLFSQWCAKSYGNELTPAGPESLLAKYHELKKELKKNSGPVPFHVESSVDRNASRVDIYGTIGYPFGLVQKELLVPSNWCRIVLPHPNVRACTYKQVNATAWLLNIYRVGKFPEPLEDAYQMKFKYRVSELQPSYFDIALTAHEGPSHTKDHQFELEAVPLDEGGTFIHLRYSFGYSAWGYFLMKIFGGGKTGFSVVGTDSNGNPVYASGLRGAVERDVACYYLAILAYMDTLEVPDRHRFEKRISTWYHLASLYKKQLLDMGEGKYLASKRRDRRSQQHLQRELNK